MSPSGFAPGNAMAFAGMPSSKDRADLVAFLMGWTKLIPDNFNNRNG